MNFIQLFFPTTCGICNKIERSHICEECYKKIEQYLYRNTQKNIFYVLQYKDIIRNKIIEYKFKDKAYLYQMFCEIIIKNKEACEFLNSYDIIIPVPIYKKKKRRRGYNQTELIAKKLAKYFNIQIETDILLKQKDTPMQSSLGKKDRIKNIQDAYKVMNKEKIIGKKLLILDDIYTTGATVNECKRILKLNGAKRIGTIIIAKD